MERCKSLVKVNLSDGEYKGLWSAYFVEVILNNDTKSEPIEVSVGIRGINYKCEVDIIDGWLYIRG